MTEASPAAPFVVSEPHLLLQILVVALDPPAPLGHADEVGPLRTGARIEDIGAMAQDTPTVSCDSHGKVGFSLTFCVKLATISC